MKRFLSLIFLILITSCAPIYVNYDYEEKTDFSQYKTYNIHPELQSGLSQLNENRLLDAMDMTLQNKGLKVSETPDIFINIVTREFQNTNNTSVGVGVGGTGGNVGGGVSVGIPLGPSNINREIVFDIIDAKNNNLVWQAVSESAFSPKATPTKKKEKLEDIVNKVFIKYPPKK